MYNEHYQSCIIDEFVSTYFNTNDNKIKNMFRIYHQFSHYELFAISLPQARKMARLLNLDYVIYEVNSEND